MTKIIPNRKIKIAIVGCGRISKNHFASIEKHSDNLELVSVCETNSEVLKNHQEKYQINSYRSLDEMLKKEELDIVSICTPNGLHSEQAIKIAQNRVHVVSENLWLLGGQMD